MPHIMHTNELMQAAFQKKCIEYMRRDLRSKPHAVSSDKLALLLEKMINWSLLMVLIERNGACFDKAPIADNKQKELFISRSANILLLIPSLRTALSNGLLCLNQGEEPPVYALTHTEINRAHEKFQEHLLRFHTTPDISFWSGPRQNVADLSGSNALSRKRVLDGGDVIESDFKRLQV